MDTAYALRWRPNAGAQEFALRIPDNVFEILYGGARGGGKTDAGIYWMIKPIEALDWKPTVTHPFFRGLALRRSAKDLTDWLDRAERVYGAYGGVLRDKNKQPTFVFPSGAKILVGHLKDVASYQGHEYQRILIEELTQIREEDTYTKLLGSCRSTIPEIKPQVFLTTNPGGKGHGWVRRRFVTAAPWRTFFKNPASNRWAIFVPSRVEDNPKLMEADPGYVQWLDGIKTTNEKLYRMWREGEWDAFDGQVFTEWKYQTHVFDNFWFSLKDCERIAAFDWGYRDPASMHWIARAPENEYGVQHIFIYREVYKTEMTALQWGQLMGNIQKLDPVRHMVLPHDCFSTRPDGQTIAKVMRQHSKIPIRSAENLKHGAKLNRIALMHQLLTPSPDGYPYLLVHSSAKNFIRTVPELVYDETIVEEIDSEAEDHAFDSATYGLMSMKPKFADPALVQMQPRKPIPFKQGWKVNSKGELEMIDVMKAAAQNSHRPNGNSEF